MKLFWVTALNTMGIILLLFGFVDVVLTARATKHINVKYLYWLMVGACLVLGLAAYIRDN